MNAAMYKALSGAVTQMRRLETTAQNIANLGTVGYKTERLSFAEIVAGGLREREHTGGLVAVVEQRTDLSQGPLDETGNPLDLAIDGDGFFSVQTPRGVRYTRAGIFRLSSDGTVTTPLGDALLGAQGPIRVQGETVKVSPQGAVLVDGAEVGTIRVVRFDDPRVLAKEGQNLFVAPDGTETPATDFQVRQGMLERANVSAIEEMVKLITLQRQFEAYERAMRMMDSATERLLTEAARL